MHFFEESNLSAIGKMRLRKINSQEIIATSKKSIAKRFAKRVRHYSCGGAGTVEWAECSCRP